MHLSDDFHLFIVMKPKKEEAVTKQGALGLTSLSIPHLTQVVLGVSKTDTPSALSLSHRPFSALPGIPTACVCMSVPRKLFLQPGKAALLPTSTW
jgi:hypothetical protein